MQQQGYPGEKNALEPLMSAANGIKIIQDTLVWCEQPQILSCNGEKKNWLREKKIMGMEA